MSVLRSWKFWLGFTVSAACIVFAFWGIDRRAFISTFEQISWMWFVGATLWVVLALWIRAYRWKLLTSHLKRVGTYRLFQALCIGFAVNNLLPARIGELARTYTLSRTEDMKFSGVFATVVAERIYDSVSFTILLVLFLAFVEVPIFQRLGISQQKFTMTMLLLLSFGIMFILLLRLKPRAIERAVRRFFGLFSRRLADRLADEVTHFSAGISHSASAGALAALATVSFLIWVVSIFQFWLAAGSLGVDLGVKNSFVLMVAVLFGISIPASPGYVGTYHLAAMKVLQASGYPPELSLSVAIVVHITNYIMQTALGLWYLKSIGLGLKDVSRKVAEEEEELSGAAEAVVGQQDPPGVSER